MGTMERSMLVMIPLDKLVKKLNPFIGFGVFFLLFLATKNISDGSVGIGNKVLFEIPTDLMMRIYLFCALKVSTLLQKFS